jgi:hypothetical protein
VTSVSFPPPKKVIYNVIETHKEYQFLSTVFMNDMTTLNAKPMPNQVWDNT